MRFIFYLFLLLYFFPQAGLAQVAFSESTLPIFIIQTNGQNIPNEPKITANLGVIYNGPGEVNSVFDAFNIYDGLVGIERRGATSQLFFPKTPYALELRNAAGSDNKIPLLGMPEESDWALISNYNDKSLIRDALAYTLAGRVMAYAPRTRFVELMLNDEYQGVYLLTERVKRDPNRVAIKKNNPGEDISGGYILKLDKEEGDSVLGNWISHVPPPNAAFGQKIRFLYHYPRTEDLSIAQRQYIQQWMFSFEENLRSTGFADPLSGYRKYIDPATFIDYMWLNEAFKNIDGYRLSTFFYKDQDTLDGRLKMGPVWDFNLAFGNCNYCTAENTQGWMWNFNQYCPQDDWLMPFWWNRLRQDTNFLIEAQQRWKILRAGTLSDQAVLSAIDSLAAVLDNGPRMRNFERWPVLGVWVWPNNFVGNTYPEELFYLKAWLIDRLHWMDSAATQLYVGTSQPISYFEPRVIPSLARGETRIQCSTKTSTKIQWDLFDAGGRVYYRQATALKPPGVYDLEILLPETTGVYFLKITLEGKSYIRKVVVY